MKKTILSLLAFPLVLGANAQNILNPSEWNLGFGTVGNFYQSGVADENLREWGEGPLGRTILWTAIPNGGNGPDGGWDSKFLPIDHTKRYRLTVWIKKTGSHSGTSYLGTRADGNEPPLTSLEGVPNSNPYFFSADLPQLNKWYLVVGYVHGSGDNSMVSEGGIYDGETGQKVVNLRAFKFQVGNTLLRHRSYLYYVTDLNDRQYFWGPRMEEVNGNEPTIAALLGISTQVAINSSTIYPSRVGINTNAAGMSNYELAVNGEIRAKEIKVETNWADFVFEKDYPLLPLDELALYINEHKHLPEIPTADQVASEGIEVGNMNKLLLQKIEELTLYILEQNKLLKEQQIRIEVLEKDK